MKIKIENCSDSLLWYGKHVGETFEVYHEESEIYWTRETNIWRALNWVKKSDCIVVKEPDEEH